VGVGLSIEQNALQNRNTHASDENRNPALKSVADYKLSQFIFFTIVPCSILILSKFFIYQLMHKRNALKRILKLTLKQLLHVSVQSPSSGSVLFELAKVIASFSKFK